jgi:hypothetical protein
MAGGQRAPVRRTSLLCRGLHCEHLLLIKLEVLHLSYDGIQALSRAHVGCDLRHGQTSKGDGRDTLTPKRSMISVSRFPSIWMFSLSSSLFQTRRIRDWVREASRKFFTSSASL